MTDAREYGRALFQLAKESGRDDAVREDCLALNEAICKNPEYTKLLDTPALSREERLSLIDGALGCLDEYLLNLVKILSEKHLGYALDSALSGFFEAYDDSHGIERVEAITVQPLTEEQTCVLTKKLEEITGKTIIIKNTVDAAILGGMKLRYCGKQLDGSVKTRLDSLDQSLKSTII